MAVRLVESVFFHNERCYRAGADLDFAITLKGLPADDKIYFYYELNANCQPKGKCRSTAPRMLSKTSA